METKSTKWLLALLFTGTLMGALDLAIIGPALPVIQLEFDMQQRQLAGLINAYTLFQMFGALLLAKLADRIGPRLIYIISILLFATGSLMLVVAESTAILYAGRAIQGFGAGGIFPAAAAVIGARLGPRERGQALGILGMVWGLAFLVGPILGGILLRFSWQWLFAINLPIAAVLILGAIKLLPSALGALMMAITSVDTNAMLDSLLTLQVGGSLVLIAVLTAIFWRIEKSAIDPIVRPALFASTQISKSCIISTGVSAVQSGGIFLPALLVVSLGISPADSALLLLPGVVAATIAAPVFGRMINKVGTRFIIVLGQALVLGSLAIYAFTDLTIITFLFASIIGGIGSAGLVGAPLRYIMLAETDNRDRAAGQGLLSVVSSVGRLLGAALVGAVATSRGGGTVGYQAAFVGLVLLSVLILLMAMTLKSRATERIDGENSDEEAAAKSALT